MERKRIIQIVVIAIALCGICFIGMECKRYFEEEQQKVEAEQKKAEEAQRMEQIQSNFEELVVFAQEYHESIEKLSIVSVEYMIEVMDTHAFDYERACELAAIGEDGKIIKDKLYLDSSVIKYSIEWWKEYPEMCPEVKYRYYSGEVGSTEMYLVYFYTDDPKEAFENSGLRSSYNEYAQITERLYAFYFEPPYTCS